MKPNILEISRELAVGATGLAQPFELATAVEAGMARTAPLELPELPEVEVVRHYTNLTRENYGVDSGTYPLGSCTMKYNPKRNDAVAALDGFRNVHPEVGEAGMQGVLGELYGFQESLAEILGVDHISLQPAAGAHGELAGLLVIKKYLESQGESRDVVLIADSAHGTNPASAAMAGFRCRIVPTTEEGLMDLDSLKSQLDGDVAALMLTNPSTLGLFEENIDRIAKMIHDNGSLLYYDGANLNALVGRMRPGDMGFDVVHINTHKTFSTPHGGGGPGAGPVGVKAFLFDYLPVPLIAEQGGRYTLDFSPRQTIGRVRANLAHVDVLLRAWAYVLTLGAAGLRETSENAVLNANYVQERLRKIIPPVYDKRCMHECLLSGAELRISAYNFAKRLIDYEVHPPTLLGAGCVYFSDDLKSAMLIEPTETETQRDLDRLIEVFYLVSEEADSNKAYVEQAPHSRSVSKIELGTPEVDL